jgi:methionyl-tRNA formyltransferase
LHVLLLSPRPENISATIAKAKDTFLSTTGKIDLAFLRQHNFDFIVSYNYRHVIKKALMEEFPLKIINLHISYLPYNRGADPNFWSFFDDTPKGVTIHLIDEGLDTGNIIARRLVELSPSDTLSSSYLKLHHSLSSMFEQKWSEIRLGQHAEAPQERPGTFHFSADKSHFMARLPLGWDTPVAEVEALGRAHRAASQALR